MVMTTKKKKTEPRRKRMTFSAIVVCGVFFAALIFATVLIIRHFHIRFTPTVNNSERLLERGRPREAFEQLEQMKHRKQGDARALFLRGNVLFAMLMEEMRAERWSSFGMNPNNWLAHPYADEAEKSFLDAMAIEPYNVDIRHALGNLYREQGRFSEAESMLRSALQIDPNCADAFLALGMLYAEGQRLEPAHRAFIAAWERDPENPQIAKNIGLFYRFYANNPGAAIEWFNLYLDLNPRRDSDINFIRSELRNLYERYPEFGTYDRDHQIANRGVGRTFNSRFGR